MFPTDDPRPSRSWDELIQHSRRRGRALRRRRLALAGTAQALVASIALLVTLTLPGADQTLRATDTPDDQRRTEVTLVPTTTPHRRPPAFVADRDSVREHESPSPTSTTTHDSPTTTTTTFRGVGRRGADGRRIAFYRGDQLRGDGEVWIVNEDGTDARFVTRSSWCRPDWSPDRAVLVFCRATTEPSPYGSVSVIHAVDLRDGSVRQLRRGFDAVYSPDGMRIAFTDDSADYGDIWTMAADGTDLRRLTGGADADYLARYSPDGSRLLFIRSSGVSALGTVSLWVVNADGSSPRMITDELTGAVTQADWSPDGRKIVYTCNGGGVCIIGADGTGRTKVTEPPPGGHAGDPNWSDDGSSIVYIQDTDNPYTGVPIELWVVRADGTGKRRVTSGGRDMGDAAPVFEPGG